MIHPERRRENLKKIEEMDKQDALISRRQAVSRMSDLICLELKGKCPTWNDVYHAMNELPTVETELLKEQEAVKPRVSSVEQRCGNCNKIIEMDGWKACPWCGKPILWETVGRSVNR